MPLQADGWSLAPFLRGEPAPEHWRDTAHFEWSFSDPVDQMAETAFGIPMSHCALAVSRGPRHKYVQFAAVDGLFPPLLFDLTADPEQSPQPAGRAAARTRERRRPGQATPGAAAVAHAHRRADAERQLPPAERGLVEARDTWR